jgi:hypothetical protein
MPEKDSTTSNNTRPYIVLLQLTHELDEEGKAQPATNLFRFVDIFKASTPAEARKLAATQTGEDGLYVATVESSWSEKTIKFNREPRIEEVD